jgi:anti-anti-sigma regulatory factor
MEITVSQATGRVEVTILQPHGDLDAASYTDLIAAAQEAQQAGASDILLDLGDTPYMSSSGLVALQSIAALLREEEPPDLEAGWSTLRGLKRGAEAGCQEHFKLLNPRPRVARVLEMVGFAQFLEVYSDLEEAVASF